MLFRQPWVTCMYKPRGRNFKTLLALVVAALAYGSLLLVRHTLTGRSALDGGIGVLLGLYICSQPAANMVDLILFGRLARPQFSSRHSLTLWLALNVLVLVIGFIVVVVGTTRFAGRIPT